MIIEPQPREGVFDAYWKFAAERHAMFMRRIEGKPAPWTADGILRDHKFCCTFRAADRVSQYLIRELYADPSASKADLAFRAVAFRTFGRPEAWEAIKQALGHQPRVGDLQGGMAGAFGQSVEAVAATGLKMYTSAYMIPSGSGKYKDERKHRSFVPLYHDMFIGGAAGDRIAEAGSMESVVGILQSYPMLGPFLAYQIGVDINYSTATDFDENDFTQPGPGADRGLEKVFTSLNGNSARRVIDWMVENQDAQFERLGLDFPGLWGRKLHAIDCQGLFCETDKYSRVAFPELASNRTKIKAKFNHPNPEPLTLFFPPKWGINEKLPKGPVLGVATGEVV